VITPDPPRLRLALALGDQEREQRLRPALDEDPELLVAAQCLAADQVLGAVESRQVDAVIIAWGLHRLSESLLAQLERSGLPLVVLVPAAELDGWRKRHRLVLPLDVDAATVCAVIKAAGRGERLVLSRDRARAEAAPSELRETPGSQELAVLAVTGGHSSPGRTTIAINLAAALGAVAPTVLLDLDLSAPSTHAYLDRDPSRNICTLAHAVRENSHAWGGVLRDELQPLGVRNSSAQILCGLPKPEMRSSLTPQFVRRLVAEASSQARYVVLDVGPDLLGMEAAASAHRAALSAAHCVLLVASADLVGLWQARSALGLIEAQVQVDRSRMSLVLNRFDARHHHARVEVEWHLGLPAAAVVPHDHAATQRAIANQEPLVLDSNSRAARAILGLAERVHQGSVRLPDARTARGNKNWLQRGWGAPSFVAWRIGRSAMRRPTSMVAARVPADRDPESPW
jgi:Flp pilus assembly CpaE family ATPase